ncbi:suppressor of cytokine signaling 2-like isoform X2 [Scleropages formosus]|nr:suppressor of cytokine signaling 2-like isoform X2 [Scleropages formosus]
MGHTHCVSSTPETETQSLRTEGGSGRVPGTFPCQANKSTSSLTEAGRMIVPNQISEKSVVPVRLKDPGLESRQEDAMIDVVRVDNAMTHLQQSGWYWGPITASQAKQALNDALEGTFLLRDSSNPAYSLTLSVKTSLGPTHLRIQYSGGLFGFDSLAVARPRLRQFGGAVDLVQHYALACQRPAAGRWRCGGEARVEEDEEAPTSATFPTEVSLPLKLSRPLYQSAPSLQHLCRIAINQHSRCHQDLPLPPRLKDYLEGYPFVL